jgi:hypothetical protein
MNNQSCGSNTIHTSTWTPLNLYDWRRENFCACKLSKYVVNDEHPKENFCPCKRNTSINCNSWSNVNDEHPTKSWDFPKENFCMSKPENFTGGYLKLKNIH